METNEAVNAFEQALGRLREVVAEPETAIIRDAAIKRFEFTFELAWKVIQSDLQEPQRRLSPAVRAATTRVGKPPRIIMSTYLTPSTQSTG